MRMRKNQSKGAKGAKKAPKRWVHRGAPAMNRSAGRSTSKMGRR